MTPDAVEPPGDLGREALERESVVEYVRVRGPGGQHRNKRETGVRLHHGPSGIIVVATERRSRARNLDAAFERLAARLAELYCVPEERVPTRVPKRVKAVRVAEKRRVSARKALRRKPADED
jgi:protein subunit release factor A